MTTSSVPLSQPPNSATPVAMAGTLVPTRAWVYFWQGLFSSVITSGEIILYSGTSAPSGYVTCDGSAVSRATYPSLNQLAAAAKYASPWGPGDGKTTFNVPNISPTSGCSYIIKS